MSWVNPTKGWGNPKSVSFEKRHVRMVVVDHHRLKVHRVLAPVVERILLDLAAQGLTAQTEGWTAGGDGREFRIVVDGMGPERTNAAMLSYGFGPSGAENTYRWTSESPPEEAEASPDAPESPKAPDLTPITTLLVPEALEGDHRLGSRDLVAGDIGADVLTLQVFLNAPRTGTYDPDTESAVKLFHQRKGFVSDGSMPLSAQRWIIPQNIERLRTGAAGLTVMLLSSALIAKQILPIDSPVESRYTVALANTIRDYRESLGLPRSEVVDSPTWASLVVQPRG